MIFGLRSCGGLGGLFPDVFREMNDTPSARITCKLFLWMAVPALCRTPAKITLQSGEFALSSEPRSLTQIVKVMALALLVVAKYPK